MLIETKQDILDELKNTIEGLETIIALKKLGLVNADELINKRIERLKKVTEFINNN